MLNLGIISDEVSDDFERSCALIGAWGLAHVELRMLWGKNILELSETELVRAQAALNEHKLEVTAIASPIFKSPLDGKPRQMQADFALGGAESYEAQLVLLDKAAGLCRRFGTRKLRVFTFWREPWSDALVRAVSDKLIQAAEVARARDTLLVVENEPVCAVATGEELGALFKLIRERAPKDLLDHLAALWDPGNALAAGERAYPDGYDALDACPIAHVHLKDLTRHGKGKPHFVPLGQGDIDYLAQVRRLIEDGYRGTLVLEPHYRPSDLSQEEAAHASVKAAQAVLREALS